MLLTTQYLEEADQLADRIAVIDHGRVIAEGTGSDLKASVGSGMLHMRLRDSERRRDAVDVIARHTNQDVRFERDPLALTVPVADTGQAGALISALHGAGLDMVSVGVGQPSLDEVFLTLTGQPPSPDSTSEDVR